MGTALGDLAAYTFNLGFLSAGIVFAVLFALPGIAYYALRINGVVAFWASYVVTRPLGASFADWTGKSRHAGGVGVGDGVISFILLGLIGGAVAYLTVGMGTATWSDRATGAPTGLRPTVADESATSGN